MSTTRTGSFPIGIRRIGGWQSEISVLIPWLLENQFAAIDVGPIEPEEIRQFLDAGLRIGSVDLRAWTDLASSDSAKRRDAAQMNAEYIKSVVPLGAHNFFVVMLPEDIQASRADNLKYAADGYGMLCEAIAPIGARIVLEGWPGPNPHVPALACTPESYQAVFEAVGSDVMGVNFDPSHLIRVGIDPVRFCREFADRIYHIHGKDTELMAGALYECGTLQPATLAKAHGFGGHHWRYTIPGHGTAPWPTLLAILRDEGYAGAVCIELEDENFNGTEEGEKQGFIAARDFLIHA